MTSPSKKSGHSFIVSSHPIKLALTTIYELKIYHKKIWIRNEMIIYQFAKLISPIQGIYGIIILHASNQCLLWNNGEFDNYRIMINTKLILYRKGTSVSYFRQHCHDILFKLEDINLWLYRYFLYMHALECKSLIFYK